MNINIGTNKLNANVINEKNIILKVHNLIIKTEDLLLCNNYKNVIKRFITESLITKNNLFNFLWFFDIYCIQIQKNIKTRSKKIYNMCPKSKKKQ